MEGKKRPPFNSGGRPNQKPRGGFKGNRGQKSSAGEERHQTVDPGHSVPRTSNFRRQGPSLRRSDSDLNAQHSKQSGAVNGKDQFQRIKHFGFNRLNALSKLSGVEILAMLSRTETMDEFLSLTKQDLKDCFMLCLVEILGKLACLEFSELGVQVLIRVSDTGFLQKLLLFIVTFGYDEDRLKSSFSFFHGLAGFCSGLVKFLPTLACEKLTPLLKEAIRVLADLQFDEKENIAKSLSLTLEKLNMEREKRSNQRVIRKAVEDAQQFNTPPNNFRELNVIPKSDDLHFGDKVFLRPMIIQGPFRSVDHYLDVLFRLLREDFFRPLREGIKEYIWKTREAASSSSKQKRIKVDNVKIYENVAILGPQIDEDSVGMCIAFDIAKKFCTTMNWETSKRFMLGSLLVLSKDTFETIILATVLKRSQEELKEGRVLIEFVEDFEEVENLYSQNWKMAESNLFFGAYSHVLEALQRFDEDSLPLKDVIVEAKVEPTPPLYVSKNLDQMYRLPLPLEETEGDISPEVEEDRPTVRPTIDVNILDLGSWPSAETLGLDDSQYEAFKGALTQKVMLIQGPPGTGKTYLGLKVASALLENTDLWTSNLDSRPLVVVTYTNHALDQFLMGLIPFTDSLMRVGGGCKEKELENFSLHNLRHSVRTGGVHHIVRNFRDTFKNESNKYKLLERIKSMIEQGCGIVDPETFLAMKVMSDRQAMSFDDPVDFVEWLEVGFDLKYLTRKCELNLFEPMGDGHDDRFNLIVSFTTIDQVTSRSEDKALTHYLFQKKMYLEHQLKNPLTKPESLNVNVERLRNLKSLRLEQRWQLYRSWISELLKKIQVLLNEIQPRLIKAASNLKQAKLVEEGAIMSTRRVIGMTTSYAASHQSTLKHLKPRIVIVEEAAEVLEGHVLVSLTGNLEHLIMIGDHLQLRPNPAVHELATKYHLNVSLFERLLNNEVQCVTLSTQHRMRPEIAKLISPAIYPNLINHDSVLNYPLVKGVVKSVAFIDHQHHQEEVEEIQSFRNVHEGELISALARYLILQGYEPTKITILATYKGQMFYLHKLRQKNSYLEKIRITVVDNYQGEENDIILLSLVRSNDDGNVGFLKTENRVCVALSRAKHGMYIVGNMQNMLSKGDIWPKIAEELKKQDSLVEALELHCEVHGTRNKVQAADDFNNMPEGGCLLQCGSLLECGHICAQVCHTYDRTHSNFKCHEQCERPVCPQNHICPDKCFKTCGPCLVPKSVTLRCTHEAEMPCYVDPKSYECLVSVMCRLVPCGHERQVLCNLSKNPSSIKCLEACKVRLECGHSCIRNCHLLDDPLHELYKCTKLCGRKNEGCSEEHFCQKACHQECDLCSIMVKKLLSCGHKRTIKCHEEPSRYLCENKCKEFNTCGHKCMKKCKDVCDPCLTVVEKVIPKCGHKQKMLCSEKPENFTKCQSPCKLKLLCGHSCQKKCHEPCDPVCKEYTDYARVPACGHTIQVPCYKNRTLDPNSQELLNYCKTPCTAKLQPCLHECQGNCGTCWQGRLHLSCKQKCGRTLICGHSCSAPCAEACPPCNKPCSVKCEHSECFRRCGDECVPCLEKCSRQCIHERCKSRCGEICRSKPCLQPCNRSLPKCKHRCVGLCGDMCICVECNDGIRDVCFGKEEDEDARFVFLPDCKHIIEASALLKWLLEGSDIKEKLCPKCSAPIRNCLRYKDILLRHAQDVQNVKRRINGHPQKIMNLAAKISNDFNRKVPSFLYDFCWKLLKKIEDKLQLMQKLKRRGNRWWNPPLNFSEVKSLQEYCLVVERLGTITKKIYSPVKGENAYDFSAKAKKEIDDFLGNLSNNLAGRNLVSLKRQEAIDISSLLERLDCLVQISYIESSPNFHLLTDASKKIFDDLCVKVRGIGPYPSKDHPTNVQILKGVASKVQCKITPAEIKTVVAALGMSKGHWFKCPNGHYYAIGECGGATIESKCNECGARIGGSGHRLRQDNAFAPEVDGAVATAWPGTLH